MRRGSLTSVRVYAHIPVCTYSCVNVVIGAVYTAATKFVSEIEIGVARRVGDRSDARERERERERDR
jgi:hypothetical protein